MRLFKFLIIGILFGIILVKAEVISWFRIQEMFWFQSFHMYGIIGSAVVIGAISVQLIKHYNIKTIKGETINLTPRPFTFKANLIGGTLFGLGWALTGACPGPLYALAGSGYGVVVITLLSAVFGVFIYGLIKNKLPH